MSSNERYAFIAENRQWIADWRAGLFTPANWARVGPHRESGPWPVEMVGVVDDLEKALDLLENKD